LKSLEEKATQTIEIAEFVPSTRSIRSTSDKAYYLAPRRAARRPTAC